MKVFKNPTPISFKVEDCDGNEKVLTLKPCNKKLVDEINASRDQDLYYQAVILFGGEIKDYENISLQVLSSAIPYAVKTIQNPTEQTEEK